MNTSHSTQNAATKDFPYASTILSRKSLHNSSGSSPAKPRTFEVVIQRDPQQLPFMPGDSLAIATENPSVTTKPYIDLFLVAFAKNSFQYITKDALSTAFTSTVELSKFPSFNFQKLAKLFALQPETICDLEENNCPPISSENAVDPSLYHQSLLYRTLAWTLEKQKEIWSMLRIEELVAALPKLAPRLYSIASSPTLEENIVRLMIGHHKHPEGLWFGACSHSLCYEKEIGSALNVWIHPARKFRDLNSERDLVMIGAGTGLAPYRSFLLEREHNKSRALHWLFFGERHREKDFYYEEIWKELSIDLKVTTAFSRDQKEKVYVQHRLWEEKEAVWQLIAKGALFLLCGDAHKMAKDVEATLCKIAQSVGGIEDTKTWLRQLVRSGQLCKDVY